jgi:hypothetical protein
MLDANQQEAFMIMMKRLRPDAQDTLTMQEAGPFYRGGRTTVVKWDPNDPQKKRAWAGSETGGLWRNDNVFDPASRWVPISDGWGNMNISCIAFNPTNKEEVWVGTGNSHTVIDHINSLPYKGGGVWRSEDGGANFRNLSSTTRPEMEFITALVIHPTTKAIYLGTASHGLFRSTNSGASWAQVLSGPHPYVHDIAVGMDGSLNVAVGEQQPTGSISLLKVMRSPTGNVDSWVVSHDFTGQGLKTGRLEMEPTKNANLYCLYCTSSSTGFVKSTNNGGSYAEGRNFAQPVMNGGSQFFAAAVESPTIFMMGSIATVWYDPRLADGEPIPGIHGDVSSIDVIRQESDNAASYLIGTDGGVYMMKGNSASVRECNFGYSTTQNSYGLIVGNGNTFAVGPWDWAVTSWDLDGEEVEDLTEDPDVTSLFYGRANGILLSTSAFGRGRFKISKALDPQATPYDVPIRGLGNSVPPQATYFNRRVFHAATGIFFEGGKSGTLYRYHFPIEYGPPPRVDSIQLGLADDITSLSFSTVEGDLLLVGTSSGRLFKIPNALTSTPSFREIPTATLPNDSVTSFHACDDGKGLIVAFYKAGGVALWYSSNNGGIWQDHTSVNNMRGLRSIFVNPFDSKKVMLTTDRGCWFTTHVAGGRWLKLSHIPNTIATQFDFRASDRRLVVATWGRGLYHGTFPDRMPLMLPYEVNVPSMKMGSDQFKLRNAGDNAFGWQPATRVQGGELEVFALVCLNYGRPASPRPNDTIALPAFYSGVIHSTDSFYIEYSHAKRNSVPASEYLLLESSIDGGKTWRIIGELKGAAIITSPAQEGTFIPTSESQWKRHAFPLGKVSSSPQGQGVVKFRLICRGASNNNVYIRKIELGKSI